MAQSGIPSCSRNVDERSARASQSLAGIRPLEGLHARLAAHLPPLGSSTVSISCCASRRICCLSSIAAASRPCALASARTSSKRELTASRSSSSSSNSSSPCANHLHLHWKGLNLRDPKWNLTGLNRWLEAFEKCEACLAFESDCCTHIEDIPPQWAAGAQGSEMVLDAMQWNGAKGWADADRFQRGPFAANDFVNLATVVLPILPVCCCKKRSMLHPRATHSRAARHSPRFPRPAHPGR